jgi:SnoaL-like domain
VSEINATDTAALVDTYCRAWSEPDADARQLLLDEAWDEDGTYTDPMSDVAGRAALHEYIGASFDAFPGMVIAATSAVDVHHDKGRFDWQLTLPDGSVPVAGTDFVQVTAQGQIRSIVGFFGPLSRKT